MRLSMRSIRQRARSAKPLADDLGFDPSKDMLFSWSGIKLCVDLEIAPKEPENVEFFCQISGADHTIVHGKDLGNDGTEESSSTRESLGFKYETDAIKDHLLTIDENDERYCHNDPTRVLTGGVEDKCGAAAEPSTNGTHSTWPDWGEPLPPEDLDDIDYIPDGGINPKVKQLVNANTFFEPSSLEEDMKIGSLSYARSSDEELEQGLTEKGILNSADVSAACHLFDLGNALPYGGGLESAGLCGKRNCDFYDPSGDLERLSELVEKLYAAVPQLSAVSNSQGSVSTNEVGFWTVEVSKDSGRLRMKRIKCEKEAEFEGLGAIDVDDDNEVLERPHSKRQYKLLRKLS